jgi:hypothetical protein
VHPPGVIRTTVKQWLIDQGFWFQPKDGIILRISANEYINLCIFAARVGRLLWLGAFGRTGRS